MCGREVAVQSGLHTDLVQTHTAVERIKSVATFVCESVARHTIRLDPFCPSLSNDPFCRLLLIVFLGLYPLLAKVDKDVIKGEIWGKKIADIAVNFADF